MFKTRVEVPPPNRPGIPPDIITWADAAYLGWFKKDISALRPRVDVLVASCHWGLGKDVLQYMTEIACGDRCGRRHRGRPRAALFAADRGTGASRSSTGSATSRSTPATADASTATGSARWCGRARAARIERVAFQFVRHNDRNETVPCDMAKEAEKLADIVTRSAPFGTRFVTDGTRCGWSLITYSGEPSYRVPAGRALGYEFLHPLVHASASRDPRAMRWLSEQRNYCASRLFRWVPGLVPLRFTRPGHESSTSPPPPSAPRRRGSRPTPSRARRCDRARPARAEVRSAR
jgi:hypothetical protein